MSDRNLTAKSCSGRITSTSTLRRPNNTPAIAPIPAPPNTSSVAIALSPVMPASAAAAAAPNAAPCANEPVPAPFWTLSVSGNNS